MDPGVTGGAKVGATCSGCARKVTGTEGCVGGGSGCGWTGVAAVAAVAVYDGENGFVERVGDGASLSKSSALSLTWRTSCSWWYCRAARRSRKTAWYPWVFPGSEIWLAGSCEVVSGFTVGSRPAPEVLAPRGGMPGVAVCRAKLPRMDSTVRDVLHVCAGGSRGVPLLAGAGGTRSVGPSHVGVGNVSLSHVDVEERWDERLHWRIDWWGGSV